MTRKKLVRRIIKRIIPIGFLLWIYWPIVALYFVSGIYDVLRHKNKDKAFIFKQYFFENGTLTWLFSPINMLIDILSLPYINKQIYKLEDLPNRYQIEIKKILDETPRAQIVKILDDLSKNNERTMLFYKWYSYNVETDHPIPLFHEKFKKVMTIGVSSFNANSSTSKHFGWLRAGIRVLINIDENVDEKAWIDVNNQRHVWKTDGPLFIFDDTVVHQSVNYSDQKRNNLFIDVTRPSMFPFLINMFFYSFGFITTHVKAFSKLSNWKVVK